MRNKISMLTLSLVCVATFADIDANAQRKVKRTGRFASTHKIQKASDYANSAGANTSNATANGKVVTAADCGAGTYFNGTSGCNACPTGKWSTVGSTTCNDCGTGVKICDSTNGNALVCETGYKLDGVTCVADTTTTPPTTTDPKGGFKELREKYALQLAEVNASCGFIEDKLEKIKGLDTANTVAGAGTTLAAGGALTTSIIKNNKDNKAMELKAADLDKNYDEWLAKVDKEQEKISDPDAKKEDVIASAKVAKELADEAGFKDKDLDKAVKSSDKSKTVAPEEIQKLKDKIAEIDEKLGETEDEAEKAKLTEEKAGLEKQIKEAEKAEEAAKNEEVKYSEGLKEVVKKALENMKKISKDDYKDAQTAKTDTKALGMATTALMGAATIGSGVSLGTSMAAVSNSDKIINDITECNKRVDDLDKISKNMNLFEDDAKNSEGVQKIKALSDRIVETCKFSTEEIGTIKNLNFGSAVVSGIGTATGAAGTITSAVSNSDKISAKAKKGTNVATIVLAGVTTGTGITTTTLGGISIGKIKPIIEKAAKCKEILTTDIVKVNTEPVIVDIPYVGGNTTKDPATDTTTDPTTQP